MKNPPILRCSRTVSGALFFAFLFSSQPVPASQAGQSMQDMPGMSSGPGASSPSASESDHACEAGMDGMNVMSGMGESMAAMSNHMCMTPLRPKQPGDEEKAKAVVLAVRTMMEKYKDYKKALADGYVIVNPKLEQPQYHFNSPSNFRLADRQFDPTKPSSLLYRRTPNRRFKLEGVMFTDRVDAPEDELDQRIPLSIAHWHQHTNFCAAPAEKVKDYHGEHPKFGMFGSIHTGPACEAEGGTFYPVMFQWMIHVFPYEDNIKDTFSMDNDTPHVH